MAEVHEIRRKIMAEYDNDLGKYCAALMQRQATSGRKYVSVLPAKTRAFRNGKSRVIVARTTRKPAK